MFVVVDNEDVFIEEDLGKIADIYGITVKTLQKNMKLRIQSESLLRKGVKIYSLRNYLKKIGYVDIYEVNRSLDLVIHKIRDYVDQDIIDYIEEVKRSMR